MWSIGSPSTLVSPSLVPSINNVGRISAVASSPDGKFFAVLRSNGELQIWNGGAEYILLGSTRTYFGADTDNDMPDKLMSCTGPRHHLAWRSDSGAICCFELGKTFQLNSLSIFSVITREDIQALKLSPSSWNEPTTHCIVSIKPLFALITPPQNTNISITQRTSLPSPPMALATLKGCLDVASLLLVSCRCGALLVIKFDGSILRVHPAISIPFTNSKVDKNGDPVHIILMSGSRQPSGLILIGAVLSNGEAWSALFSTDISELLYTFNMSKPHLSDSQATAIAVHESLVSVGWWAQRSVVHLYRLEAQTKVNCSPWEVTQKMELNLDAWGWGGKGSQLSNVGAVCAMKFEENGTALIVAYSRRGIVVWCPMQGTRLLTCLPDLAPEGGTGGGEEELDLAVIPAPPHVSAVQALGCGGVSCFSLSNEGYQLVAVPASSTKRVEGERDTCMVVFNLLRSNGRCGTLTSPTSVAVLERVPRHSSSNQFSFCARYRWRLIPLPQHYSTTNKPIRITTMSESGHVAVAGKKGLALLHQCSLSAIGTPGGDRWRLFGNAQEERSLAVCACALAEDLVFVCSQDQLLVFPRQRLDASSLLTSAPLPEISPTFLFVHSDELSTRVLVADSTHFVIFELTDSLSVVSEGHFFETSPKCVLLARKAGRVVVIVLDINGTLTTMDTYENSRQIVALNITDIWGFSHDHSPLAPMFLLFVHTSDASYLRAWVPSIMIDIGSPLLLPVDRDEKVIGPIARVAVLLTVRHEVDRSLTGDWHCSPLHEPQPVLRPLLGAPIRLLVQEVVRMGAHRRYLAEFVRTFAQNSVTQAGLAMALEHLVVDTASSKETKEIAVLLDVTWHEANFCFHTMVASAARQLDPSRSALLFSSSLSPEFTPRPFLCHSPATLSRDCLARGMMHIAASYLALMGPPEPNTAALSTALEVLEALLCAEQDEAGLVCEVWGFLGRHLNSGKQTQIVIDEDGSLLSKPLVSSRGEVLSLFVVRRLQAGHLPSALRPLLNIPELFEDLLPCSIVSSNTPHQQLMFAFLTIEKGLTLSKFSTRDELPSNVAEVLEYLLAVSNALHFHSFRLAAATVLEDIDSVSSICEEDFCPTTHKAVMEVLNLELNGIWGRILNSP